MELFNKNENWWLRFTIVFITVMSLATLSYYNRQIMEVKTNSKVDSLSHLKVKYDSLMTINDSLKYENNFMLDQIGKRDLLIDQAKMASPRMMNELFKNIEGIASYE